MITTLIVLVSLGFFYFLVSTLIANGMAMSNRVPVTGTPADLGLSYIDVSFHSRIDNILIKGWYIPGGDKGTIIVMHGGKQCRNDDTIDLLYLCGDLSRKGFNILTFDRRGCGLSQTARLRSRACFDRDFGGAFDFVLDQNQADEKVFLLGISIGAVSAIVFASRQDGISGIVSDSCFASNYRMGYRVMGQKFPLFKIFTPGSIVMGYLLTGLIRYSAIDRVSFVKSPILLINGGNDMAVPLEDARLLYKASSNEENGIWIVENAGHSLAYRTKPEEYVDKVTAFFSQAL
jgi:alpha-beta hydrolase superfamily lysophospholipase